MKGIGGNITAVIQTATTAQNAIGEQVKTWTDAQTLKGWLDLTSGDSKYLTYNAKLQESTHVFVADFVPLASGIAAENSRMVINGKVYDILLIDNPMEMGSGSQLEIYLKFTGGQ
nr:MAG TPA: head tail adaptor [Caudoviricetes sp.]